MDRILIIEEDRACREQFASWLQDAGFIVDTAASGADGCALLAGQSYALVVISDAPAGAVQGLSLVGRLAAPGATCASILLVDPLHSDTETAALQQGACHCLRKPVHAAVLLHEVRHSLELRRLSAENGELHTMVGLLQTGHALSCSLDPGEASQLIVDALAREAGVTRAMGFVKDGDSLVCLALKGGYEVSPLFCEQVGTLVQRHAIRSGRPLRLLLAPECQEPELLDIREALIVPLVVHATLVGCVVLFNDVGQLLPPALNDHAISFLQEQGARALENALKFASTRDMLYIDELSGLFNYRYLKVALEREIKRADRYATQLTVMFLDLDNFKAVNDTYGHMVGSAVLRELGALLKKSLREVDVLIRYGGDEYTIILVEAGPEMGQRVGERIRMQVEQHHFLISEGYSISVTASIGFASYPDDTTSMQELLAMADQAMYVGKASGKNCVFRVASPLAAAGRHHEE